MILANDPTYDFSSRIIGMMRDNQCTMVEALLWDFESFGYNASEDYYNHGSAYIESNFLKYLQDNGVNEATRSFYLHVFMGREPDYGLRRINNNAKSKDE